MKQYYPYLLCAVLLAGCGKTKNEKTDAAQDRMQHRIERNEVTVDTLQRRDFMRELISNGRAGSLEAQHALLRGFGNHRGDSCEERFPRRRRGADRPHRHERLCPSAA